MSCVERQLSNVKSPKLKSNFENLDWPQFQALLGRRVGFFSFWWGVIGCGSPRPEFRGSCSWRPLWRPLVVWDTRPLRFWFRPRFAQWVSSGGGSNEAKSPLGDDGLRGADSGHTEILLFIWEARGLIGYIEWGVNQYFPTTSGFKRKWVTGPEIWHHSPNKCPKKHMSSNFQASSLFF